MARTAARVSDSDAVVRVAQLRVVCGRRASGAEQRAIAATVARQGLALPEARRHIRARQWVIAALHAAGWSYQRIADAFGYSQPCAVRAVVLRPAVQDLLQRVREYQLEEIVAGRYGARAAARAAAPRVVEHVCELAGASRAPDGTRKNRARRDRDALRAGTLVLGLAGDLVERRTTVHVQTWLEQLSDGELEAYATRGIVPERLAALPPRPM